MKNYILLRAIWLAEGFFNAFIYFGMIFILPADTVLNKLKDWECKLEIENEYE